MYYVYIYLNPLKDDGYYYNDLFFEYEPFYVGRGKNKRFKSHLNNYNLKRKSLKNNILNEILSYDLTPEIIFHQTGLTYTESNNIEKKLIEIIGRIKHNEGPLSNITSGGQGTLGYVHTKEQIAKITEKNKANGTYERLSDRQKGDGNIMSGDKWHRTEEREKNFSLKMKGKSHWNNKTTSEKVEIQTKISNTLKNRKLDNIDKEIRKVNTQLFWNERKKLGNTKRLNKKVELINIITSETMIFDSISKASKHLNVSKSTIKYRFDNDKIIDNIKIIIE